MGKKVAAALVRLGIAELEERLNVDRSTISRWVRLGAFPPPHHVGARRAWFRAEVESWEVQRMAANLSARATRNATRTAGR